MHVENLVITIDPVFTDNTVNSTTLYKLSHGNITNKQLKVVLNKTLLPIIGSPGY